MFICLFIYLFILIRCALLLVRKLCNIIELLGNIVAKNKTYVHFQK